MVKVNFKNVKATTGNTNVQKGVGSYVGAVKVDVLTKHTTQNHNDREQPRSETNTETTSATSHTTSPDSEEKVSEPFCRREFESAQKTKKKTRHQRRKLADQNKKEIIDKDEPIRERTRRGHADPRQQEGRISPHGTWGSEAIKEACKQGSFHDRTTCMWARLP